MRTVCFVCGAILEGSAERETSHGLCASCVRQLTRGRSRDRWRARLREVAVAAEEGLRPPAGGPRLAA